MKESVDKIETDEEAATRVFSLPAGVLFLGAYCDTTRPRPVDDSMSDIREPLTLAPGAEGALRFSPQIAIEIHAAFVYAPDEVYLTDARLGKNSQLASAAPLSFSVLNRIVKGVCMPINFMDKHAAPGIEVLLFFENRGTERVTIEAALAYTSRQR